MSPMTGMASSSDDPAPKLSALSQSIATSSGNDKAPRTAMAVSGASCAKTSADTQKTLDDASRGSACGLLAAYDLPCPSGDATSSGDDIAPRTGVPCSGAACEVDIAPRTGAACS